MRSFDFLDLSLQQSTFNYFHGISDIAMVLQSHVPKKTSALTIYS